jgi:hypothetical protein
MSHYLQQSILSCLFLIFIVWLCAYFHLSVFQFFSFASSSSVCCLSLLAWTQTVKYEPKIWQSKQLNDYSEIILTKQHIITSSVINLGFICDETLNRLQSKEVSLLVSIPILDRIYNIISLRWGEKRQIACGGSIYQSSHVKENMGSPMR